MAAGHRAATFLASILGLGPLAGCAEVGETVPFIGPTPGIFQVVRTPMPAPGDGMPLDSPIDVLFNQAPFPDSFAGRFAVSSGPVGVTGSIGFDLIEKRARFTPARPLQPDLRYRVLVRAGAEGFDRARLPADATLVFSTGRATGGGPPSRPRPGLASEILPATFAPRCAGAGPCHGAASAAAGLDLSSASGVLASAVSRPSVEAPEVLRIAPGDHARSLLVWKMLGLPRTASANAPHGDAPLAELRAIADWIDGGALAE
jgi:hypothetical protein